ncbi:MAG TPA: hypothetical protein PL051_02645 [Candidatus Saccharibacteria bacterium]|nr:hypothetical protein [Candidatus Saccharibacteria bacterium]
MPFYERQTNKRSTSDSQGAGLCLMMTTVMASLGLASAIAVAKRLFR